MACAGLQNYAKQNCSGLQQEQHRKQQLHAPTLGQRAPTCMYTGSLSSILTTSRISNTSPGVPAGTAQQGSTARVNMVLTAQRTETRFLAAS
jgi:hypothetical protein